MARPQKVTDDQLIAYLWGHDEATTLEVAKRFRLHRSHARTRLLALPTARNIKCRCGVGDLWVIW